MEKESLINKTVRGAGWSFADSIITQGITFVVGIVLARLLTPDEYGLIGIILIFIAIFNCIVDSGFSQALIRRNDITDKDYNTVFITNMAVSLLLFAVLFFCAPIISTFFSRPELTKLMRAMSVILVINAFSIIQQTILIKKIDFKTQTKISIIASLCSGVIGIVLAVMGYGVWSLVAQQISRQSLNALLLWVFSKWRPKLKFSKESFISLFGFGWKLMTSTLIDTIWNNVYQVVIGKCYSSAVLGQYTRASQYSTLCSSTLSSTIQRVSYPALSSIQDDKPRLKAAYKRIIKVTMLVTFVLMLGMVGSAKSMILVLIGEKWLPAVPFLQIISFYMMLYPLHAINLNMLKIQGRSDMILRLEILKKIIAIGPLLLGVFVGIYWMLAGSVVVGVISYYFNARYSGDAIDYPLMEQIKDILPSFGVALIMSLSVYALSFLPLNCFILFPLQLIFGAFITIFVCSLLKLPEYLDLKDLAKGYMNRAKNII